MEKDNKPDLIHHVARLGATTLAGATVMAGLVGADNLEYGVEVAKDAALHQAGYTAISGMVTTGLYDWLVHHSEKLRYKEAVWNVAISLLTALTNYQVHEALGTPDSFNASVITFGAATFGLAGYEITHRALSNVEWVKQNKLLSRIFHKADK